MRNSTKYILVALLFLGVMLPSDRPSSSQVYILPEVISSPLIISGVGHPYVYKMDFKEDASLAGFKFSADTPSWLNFNEEKQLLYGVPESSDIGNHRIKIVLRNGKETVQHKFILTIDDQRKEDHLSIQSTEVSSYDHESKYEYYNPFSGQLTSFSYNTAFSLHDTIIASKAGIIRYVSDFEGMKNEASQNNQVFVDHLDGTKTIYTNFKTGSIFVKEGQKITYGQAIGVSIPPHCSSPFPELSNPPGLPTP